MPEASNQNELFLTFYQKVRKKGDTVKSKEYFIPIWLGFMVKQVWVISFLDEYKQRTSYLTSIFTSIKIIYLLLAMNPVM